MTAVGRELWLITSYMILSKSIIYYILLLYWMNVLASLWDISELVDSISKDGLDTSI